MEKLWVYCAGPLFNPKEKDEMSEIAARIEAAGFATFLPQRDGLELALCVQSLVQEGMPVANAQQLVSKAIFALDVYQVLVNCHAVVANLNGRVPDEGTVAEASMAWARGRPLVGYKADARSPFAGEDNPLVTGLFGFQTCATYDEVVATLVEMKPAMQNVGSHRVRREAEISTYTVLGQKLWTSMRAQAGMEKIVGILVGKEDAVATR